MKTDNLIKHFETLSLQKQLPSFEELETIAEVLSQQYATTQAYNRACFPSETQTSLVPEGSPWTVTSSTDVVMGEISTSESANVIATEDVSTTNELPLPPKCNNGDLTLANSTLFIRNAIWWREVCVAVAVGDPGRVWEIMKVCSTPTADSLLLAVLLNQYAGVDFYLCRKWQPELLQFSA